MIDATLNKKRLLIITIFYILTLAAAVPITTPKTNEIEHDLCCQDSVIINDL